MLQLFMLQLFILKLSMLYLQGCVTNTEKSIIQTENQLAESFYKHAVFFNGADSLLMRWRSTALSQQFMMTPAESFEKPHDFS